MMAKFSHQLLPSQNQKMKDHKDFPDLEDTFGLNYLFYTMHMLMEET